MESGAEAAAVRIIKFNKRKSNILFGFRIKAFIFGDGV